MSIEPSNHNNLRHNSLQLIPFLTSSILIQAFPRQPRNTALKKKDARVSCMHHVYHLLLSCCRSKPLLQQTKIPRIEPKKVVFSPQNKVPFFRKFWKRSVSGVLLRAERDSLIFWVDRPSAIATFTEVKARAALISH